MALLRVVILTLLFGVLWHGVQGENAAAENPCEYEGKQYKDGSSFPATDGCNTCTCNNGAVGCTEKYCPCPPDKPLVNCLVNPCSYAKCGGGRKCVPDYCGGCNANCVKVTQCKYGETTYSPGESFPAGDGCNRCSCRDDGHVICTLIACQTASCKYDGQVFPHGATFNATDGCNMCECSNGNVACTEKACVTQCKYGETTYSPGESFPAGDGCNRCSCRDDGHVVCTLIACQSPTCEYNGQTYSVGDRFTALNGCTRCVCASGGRVVCPETACRRFCPHGFKTDVNGCQLCECAPSPRFCVNKICKTDEFCNNKDCCPNWVKYARCSDPCLKRKCHKLQKCERYCNCLSRCVW